MQHFISFLLSLGLLPAGLAVLLAPGLLHVVAEGVHLLERDEQLPVGDVPGVCLQGLAAQLLVDAAQLLVEAVQLVQGAVPGEEDNSRAGVI